MKTKYTAESSQTVRTRGMNFSKSTSKRKGQKKTRKITAIAEIFFTRFFAKIKS
jgi:hypothetical protein